MWNDQGAELVLLIAGTNRDATGEPSEVWVSVTDSTVALPDDVMARIAAFGFAPTIHGEAHNGCPYS